MSLQVRKLSPAMLAEELAKLERRYGMSSANFYEQYRAGAFGDADARPDYVHWAGLCYMAARSGVLRHRSTHT